jgi:predicted nucleic acid-binding protein
MLEHGRHGVYSACQALWGISEDSMKVLLDTNIIIHREASTVIREEIDILFNWLDRLHCAKCIHPLSIAEVRKHKDPKVVETFDIKLKSYVELKTEAPESKEIQALRQNDKNERDRNDTSLIKEVFAKRVDALITEDRDIHHKAKLLGLADRVFTIDDFLEKVTAEHPDLTSYKILAVKKDHFGNINLNDHFFDSFKRDYAGFAEWFNRKADETAYVCKSETKELLAFLYVKLEEEREPYPDVTPTFTPKRRLKIGTFKVMMNGYKLGERFLKIVFDNAVALKVDEIYVTIFNKDTDQERLIALFLDWGFHHHGVKRSLSGEELVLVRDFSPHADPRHSMATYPFMSRRQRKFIVAIRPEYHTELLPDSILRTESPEDFVKNRPNRNAIRKVFISRSVRRDMVSGDIIVFYRTASGGSGHYTSVATTLGIVESVVTGIVNVDKFIALCRKRSVFSDKELKEHWDWKAWNRPFVVNFLYTYSLPKRPNFAGLKEANIITEAPRGFDEISDAAFDKLLEISDADKRLIIN